MGEEEAPAAELAPEPAAEPAPAPPKDNVPAADDDDDDEGEEGEEEKEPEPTPEEKAEALHAAAKSGDAEETHRLAVLENAPLDFVDKGGWTPLLWAACNGHEACVNSLVESGAANSMATATAEPEEGDADKQAKDPSPVRSRVAAPATVVNSPLHWAAFKGHLKICFKLLLHGVPLTDVDGEGNAALHLAAAGGDTATMVCLLNHGADLFMKNFFCNTAMDVGTKTEIRSTLKVLAMEKTYEMAPVVESHIKRDAPVKNDAKSWNGMKITKVAYPTTRTLCTGIWCRESNCEGFRLPGNGIGRFFSTDACAKQPLLDRVPAGDTLPAAFLCGVCMEQINDSEAQIKAAIENKAKEPMADQIATLERTISAGAKLGSSAALLADAETTLSRVRAEKALTDHMVVTEEARPMGLDQPIVELKKLLQVAEQEKANPELIGAATALLASVQAEFGLTNCVKVFEGLELCLEMAYRNDINRLKAAMATSQRDAGHPGQLTLAKKLLKRLTLEAAIGQLLTTPENVIEMIKVMVGKKKKAKEEEQESIVGYIHATMDADKPGEKFDSLLASLHTRVEGIENNIKEVADGIAAEECDPLNPALLARAGEQLETMKVSLAEEVEIDEQRKAAEAAAAEKAAKKAAKAAKKKKK